MSHDFTVRIVAHPFCSSAAILRFIGNLLMFPCDDVKFSHACISHLATKPVYTAFKIALFMLFLHSHAKNDSNQEQNKKKSFGKFSSISMGSAEVSKQNCQCKLFCFFFSSSIFSTLLSFYRPL